MRGQKGFSLVEVVVVMAIIAVLSAIAVPSYRNHVVSTNRVAAQQLLLHLANRQEQFLLDNRSYAPDLATLGLTVPDDVGDFYAVTATAVAGPPPGYTLTAAPLAGSVQAGDGDLTLAQDGTRTGKW